MTAHLAQHAMAATLAAGATQEDAIATGHVAMDASTGAAEVVQPTCWIEKLRSADTEQQQQRTS